MTSTIYSRSIKIPSLIPETRWPASGSRFQPSTAVISDKLLSEKPKVLFQTGIFFKW